MPFIVIFGMGSPAVKKRLVAGVTAAVANAYECPSDIVSVYFVSIAEGDYGHAGIYGSAAPVKRPFVQVHALPRSLEKKRKLVKEVAEAVAAGYGIPILIVPVYIYDCAPHDISHGGVLFCDEGQPHYDPARAL
jgi:phenylpyruvate tautomerase PptA (4-oxalocrotonate tautomerase family)